MSFFELPPPPPEPPEQPSTPEWFGPAENVLPSNFPLEELLVRTEGLTIQVHSGRAYPTGFEFTLSLLRREPRTRHHDDPIRRWHEAPSGELADDVLRFGIELADGRKATVFDRFRLLRDEEPRPEAVLMQRGGSGGSHLWELKFWTWPLPPSGPFAFVVEWPSEGIALTRVEIETQPIREAATRAVELWPGGPGDDHAGGWSGGIHVMRANS